MEKERDKFYAQYWGQKVGYSIERDMLYIVNDDNVACRAMSGKSRLSYLLKKFLVENGFDVEHEICLDFTDENHFEKEMGKCFDDVIGKIKNERKILIREEQLKRNYFE